MTLSITSPITSASMPSLLKAGALGVAWSSLMLISVPATAQTSLSESGPGFETNSDRDIFNTLSGESDKGSVLDATNPMELMQRLRQATSFNDATDPSDAIDAALRALEQSEPAAGARP